MRQLVIRDMLNPGYLLVAYSDSSRHCVLPASVPYPTHTPCKKCIQLRMVVSCITVSSRVRSTFLTLYTRLSSHSIQDLDPRASHQHAQRAIITQFLGLHSTFSFCSLTCYVLFVGSSHFHLAFPHSTSYALLNIICSKVWKHSAYMCIYISSLLPKSIKRYQTFVETTYQLKFNHRRLLTEWLTSKDLLENAPSMFVTRYTQFPFPHLLRRFRERKKKKHSQSQVDFEERDTERRVGRRSESSQKPSCAHWRHDKGK
jgi:hypothetical protein